MVNKSKQNKILLKVNIEKKFDAFSLNCSVDIPSGVTSIIGPSGSGKTTLLNCIAGVTQPDAGYISLNSNILFSSVNKTNTNLNKRGIGYVFQTHTLFPHMTVLQNIRYGYDMTPKEKKRINIDELIEIFQLSELIKRYPKNLSGGEKQRVDIARSIATSPDLLLMDEPIVSLDIKLKKIILDYLKLTWTQLQIPVLYVTHFISDAENISDKCLIISKGQKIAFGKTQAILSDKNILSLFD
ncbi:MAG: ATP-binding cassette domain-containing protein [Dehalococcoidia bacterium]